METNILDELLAKVKMLEEVNNSLKNKVAEAKSKLESKPEHEDINNNLNSKNSNVVDLEDEMIVDEENINDSEGIMKIVENRDQIINSVEERNITFIPYEQYNNLWIMGDFTNWEPKPMNRNKDIFSFNAILIKGFKYYFSFTAKDQVVVDFNQDYDTNPRSGQVNNFIDVQASENSISSLFDYKLHFNLLQDARQNYTKAKMGDEKEVILLENVVNFSIKLKERFRFLTDKKEEVSNKIRKFYE